ncbi:MAG: hypothetical protein ACE5GE_15730 [Phycisphaerae bacterium]
MKRLIPVVGLLTVVAMIGGCSIAGTWKSVRTDPADAMSKTPFQMVTFNDDGEYSATRQEGSQVMTATGTYKWDGMKLTITPSEGEQRVYPGCLDMFTGQLVLKHKHEDQKTTAWMEKVDEGT